MEKNKKREEQFLDRCIAIVLLRLFNSIQFNIFIMQIKKKKFRGEGANAPPYPTPPNDLPESERDPRL